MLLVHKPCNLAETITLTTVTEQLAYILCGFLIYDKSMFIFGTCCVSVRYICSEIISGFSVYLFYRFYFLAGFFALELVKQVFERHNIIIAVKSIYAVV